MLTTNVDSVSLVRIEVEPLADHTLVLDVPTVCMSKTKLEFFFANTHSTPERELSGASCGPPEVSFLINGIFRSRCFVAAIDTLRNCENDKFCVMRCSGSIFTALP